MRKYIMGVDFDDLTLDEAISAGHQLMGQEGFHYVVTPNPELVQMTKKNGSFAVALQQADLVLPDGIGVIYASRILGRKLKARCPGIDFASGLLKHMAEEGKRLFLLGAKPGVADLAGQKLSERYPGLVVCGTHDGYFQQDEPVVEAIREAQADVVFVCLGAPKQELWMTKYGSATGAKLMIGLGGALDVYAGVVERAPESWQKLGLEWAYRLKKEPQRIGRMSKLPLFLFASIGARIRGE